MFYECDRVKFLWSKLVQCFQNTLILPTLTPETAILGILDSVSNNSFFENNKILINHILLIFKLCVYKSREKRFINRNNLITEIQKFKSIEKEIALNNSMKTTAFRKKCHLTDNIISITSMDYVQELLIRKQVECM